MDMGSRFSVDFTYQLQDSEILWFDAPIFCEKWDAHIFFMFFFDLAHSFPRFRGTLYVVPNELSWLPLISCAPPCIVRHGIYHPRWYIRYPGATVQHRRDRRAVKRSRKIIMQGCELGRVGSSTRRTIIRTWSTSAKRYLRLRMFLFFCREHCGCRHIPTGRVCLLLHIFQAIKDARLGYRLSETAGDSRHDYQFL